MTSSLNVTPPIRLRRNPHAQACGILTLTLTAVAATGITAPAMTLIVVVAIWLGYTTTALPNSPGTATSKRDEAIVGRVIPAAVLLAVLGVAGVFTGHPSIGLATMAAAAAVLGIASAAADDPAMIAAAVQAKPATARTLAVIGVLVVAVILAVALTTT